MTVVGRSTFRFADLPGRRSADPLAAVDSQSSVRYVKLEHDPTRTAHRHPHSEEVMLIVAGHGHLWLEGDRLPVEQGDVVRVPTGAAHATIPDRGSAMELMCFFPHPDLADNMVETDIAVVNDDGDHHDPKVTS
ncbi:MAG: cupin domain-containing protein [Acidimicrobiia bacterium]|nr:cupin domain-containing protein [Acidimicrobiia bacterium]